MGVATPGSAHIPAKRAPFAALDMNGERPATEGSASTPGEAMDLDDLVDVDSESLPDWMREPLAYLRGAFDGEDEAAVLKEWVRFELAVKGVSVCFKFIFLCCAYANVPL